MNSLFVEVVISLCSLSLEQDGGHEDCDGQANAAEIRCWPACLDVWEEKICVTKLAMVRGRYAPDDVEVETGIAPQGDSCSHLEILVLWFVEASNLACRIFHAMVKLDGLVS